MQTGPARGQTMRRWLAWTGSLEIANVFLFAALIWVNTRGWDRPLIYTVLGMATLGLILFEGGLYWLLKRRQEMRHWPPRQRLALLRVLYVGTALALLVFPLTLIARLAFAAGAPAVGDLLLGGALYLFAVGEFIHYFLFKINMRPREWRAMWRHGRMPPARLRRELRRAEAAVRRGA